MDLKVDEKEIKKALMDAVMKSALGKAMISAVKQALDTERYDSPIKKALEETIRVTVKEELEANYLPEIKKVVAEKLKDAISTEIIEDAAASAVARIRDY